MRKFNIFASIILLCGVLFNLIAVYGALRTGKTIVPPVLSLGVVLVVMYILDLPRIIFRTKRFAAALKAHPDPWLVEHRETDFVWKVVGQDYENAYLVCYFTKTHPYERDRSTENAVELPLAYLVNRFDIIDDPRVPYEE